MTEVPVIDVHAHVLLPVVDEAAAVRGGNAADLLGLH